MTIRRWSLPANTLLLPVEQLKESVRRQIEYRAGDHALSIPFSRLRTRIVGAKAAAILRQFLEPRALAEAVAVAALRSGDDPVGLLEEAYPLLESFMNEGYLLPEHAAGVEAPRFSLEPETVFEGLTVVRTVALVADTEIYQLRGHDGALVALKLSREGGLQKIERIFQREAAILEHLNGSVAPRLHRSDEWQGRRYLLMDWVEGMNSEVAADHIRALPPAERDREILALYRSILRCYAELHRRGVIHGDVHSHNIFLTSDGVRLIDFGMARIPGGEGVTRRARRGGIEYYADPEYAAARLADRQVPHTSFESEQYSLAAVLYYLSTDNQYCEFATDKTSIYRQIRDVSPLPFTARRLAPWPGLEAILAKALAKEPSNRWASVAALADAIDGVAPRPVSSVATPRSATAASDSRRALLDGFLDRLRDDQLTAGVFGQAPTCSLFYGAAGIAYVAYRVATVRRDPRLLAEADLWCARARARQATAGAFYSEDRELSQSSLGEMSIFHTASGIDLVDALLAASRGDVVTLQRACSAFAEGMKRTAKGLELTLGLSGGLLGCALLVDAMAEHEIRDDSVYGLGDRLFADIDRRLRELPEISDCRRLPALGAAHGWAGILHALLLWRRYSPAVDTSAVRPRLDQLARQAQPFGEGLRWPRRLGRPVDQDYFSGWCNGSAGFVALWHLAHRLWGDPSHLELATGAAHDVWTDPSDQLGDLCCGYAGRAYALLTQYRATGEDVWLGRARELTERAVRRVGERSLKRDSLFKGLPGVALLAADLEAPESAAMPLYEPLFA